MTTDAANPPELTDRQRRILELIVHNYITDGSPVSSKSLIENLGVSSATIRNEMSALETLGFIDSPHTSAGRVPTEAGYRYFVQRLSNGRHLSLIERRMIAHQFHQAPLDIEQWMRLAAAVLARTAQGASLVTAPYSRINRFKHLELIATQGRMVLMVLVLMNGEVRQRMLTLAEPVTQPQLSETATRLTTLVLSLTASEITAKLSGLATLEREVLQLVSDLMNEADRPNLVYRDGLAELLGKFEEHEGAEQALRVLEEQTVLEDLLNEAAPTVGDVRVLIAGEGRWEDISLLSIVLGRYGIDGHATGALGVLGPTRMPYGRAISTVRYVADLMSNLMIGIYGDDAAHSAPPG
ncbi:MAG: heat-inducible transcription repressor HrcA [Anaerolineae bacterium]|nr:heat-inducible transcription repressor HrcA [Anaerolineae bacterium]